MPHPTVLARTFLELHTRLACARLKRKVPTLVRHPFDLGNLGKAFNYSGFPAGILKAAFGNHGSLLNYGIQLHFPFARLQAVLAPSFRMVPEINWRLLARHGQVTVEDLRLKFLESSGGRSIVMPLLMALSSGYVYTFADKYYIKGSTSFQKQHLQHDILIVGYDLRESVAYICVGFDIAGNYSISTVPLDTLIRAIDSTDGWDYRPIDHKHHELENFSERFKEPVYCVRLRSRGQQYLDLPCMIRQLEEYLHSKWSMQTLDNWCPIFETNNENGVYGIECYSVMREYFELHLRKDGFDMRVSRLLWEHKELMVDRLVAAEFHGLHVPAETLLAYRRLAKEAQAIHLAFYSMKIGKGMLSTLPDRLKRLDDMRAVEKSALLQLLRCNARIANR